MAIQAAPQHIRLKRKLHDRQVDLLYLPAEGASDGNDFTPSPKRQATRVFKLVNENGANRPKDDTDNKLSLDIKDSTSVPRFVLTQAEPSRKRKLATFIAERPPKKVQVDHAAEDAPSGQDSEHPSPRRRPGASTAVAAKGGKKVNGGVSAPGPSSDGQEDAFKDLLAEAEHEDRAAREKSHHASQHKFLPTGITRLKDRGNAATQAKDDTVDVKDGDSEYVYDTYVLDEVMEFDLQSAVPGSVGLLFVGEEQQPIWETYLDESDSDEGQLSDDEDSNAEDYYGADYPEDELDSDDERDIDAYQYRAQASDDEEYGSDAAAFSDEEEADGTNQWRRHLR